MQVRDFVNLVLAHYRENGRNLWWRTPREDGTFDPYVILVSEIMLQQTQVSRVTVKLTEFLKRFPTVQSLAAAPLGDVLAAWSGLGYNRRAKYLHQAAKDIQQKFGGRLPKSVEELTTLPGVGPNTAGAIAAYAYNQPVSYIETNIRTVFLHHFFKSRHDVSDRELMPLISESVTCATQTNIVSSREWYWALMDYGVFLKAAEGNASRRSRHHQAQSKFKGSRRQLRGIVLKLLASGPKPEQDIVAKTKSDTRLQSVLEDLVVEEMIYKDGSDYALGDGR